MENKTVDRIEVSNEMIEQDNPLLVFCVGRVIEVEESLT